ncbi:MAG: DUF885 family protein [Terriglobales bacterium]
MNRSTLTCALLVAMTATAMAQGSDDQALLALHKEFQDLKARIKDGVPDYTPKSIEARRLKLVALRRRLDAMNPSNWPVAEQVDYRLVRAQMDAMDFEHRVLRPWSRDPGFYVDLLRVAAYTRLPVPAEKLEEFRAQLQAVPGMVRQATGNLGGDTKGSNLPNVATELARSAIRNLTRHDGVGHEQPELPVPPEGVLGFYKLLAESMPKHHPQLADDARTAYEGVNYLTAWLESNLKGMKGKAGIGRANYNWYLKHVRLMPFTAEDVKMAGDRDLGRTLAALALERNRNRNLPELKPAASAEEYANRIRLADQHVRRFIREHAFLTLPENTAEFDNNVPWIARKSGRRNFWEEVQYRDPRPDKVHAGIPGHRFDLWLHERDKRPIRGAYTDSGRIEGWGFYLEEAMMTAGLLDDLPRTRELFYIFAAARAVRNRAELHMHTGEWNVEQAIAYMVKNVPYMDEDVARVDCEIYLRQPTYGISYQMGKVEIERLLAERMRQLGDKFRLGEFHDQFLAAGTIPVSLIRWEMTGMDLQLPK